jgi:hypothetical protein
MSETQTYRPDDYEKFVVPETVRPAEFQQLEIGRQQLNEALAGIEDIRQMFPEQSKVGAYLAKAVLRGMETSMKGRDFSFCQSVKTRITNLVGERAWVGFLGEFTVARLLDESGGTVRFPANIPDELPKPSGYDPRTEVEQDRLEGIDWWLQIGERHFAATVKTVGFSETGRNENAMIYTLDDEPPQIRTMLEELICDQNVSRGVDTRERVESVVKAVQTVKGSAARYGVEPLLIMLPPANNDPDINETTGEPNAGLIEFFQDQLAEVIKTEH